MLDGSQETARTKQLIHGNLFACVSAIVGYESLPVTTNQAWPYQLRRAQMKLMFRKKYSLDGMIHRDKMFAEKKQKPSKQREPPEDFVGGRRSVWFS